MSGLLLAGALVAGLTACGGSRSPSVASVARMSSTTRQARRAQNGSSADPALAYSQCMRSNGVRAFPDPSPGGGFLFHPGSGIDPSSPAFRAADAQCRKLMPGGGPPGPGSTTHPSAQWLAHMEKVAQCMRRHGVPDFPDPRTSVPSDPFGSGTGVISDIEGAILVFPSTMDTQSPAFVRAANGCGFPLHNH